MRTITAMVLAIVCSVSAASALAFAGDGTRLLGACENYARDSKDLLWGLCLGQVSAFADVFARGSGGARICYPEGVTTRQLVLITLKYLREHPEERRQPARELVWASHANAFSHPDGNGECL